MIVDQLEEYFMLLQTNPDIFNNDGAYFEIVLSEKIITDWQDEQKNESNNNIDIGVVYKDNYILVLRDLVKFPSGRLGPYFRIINTSDLRGGQGVAVLPIYKNKVVVLHQFRHATRKWHYEIPRGFGEPETSAKQNAEKEIQEEIGGRISQLIDLGPFNSNTGLEGTTTRLFLGYLTSLKNDNQEEGIKFHTTVEISKLEKMIADFEITDSFTIACYTRAKLLGYI